MVNLSFILSKTKCFTELKEALNNHNINKIYMNDININYAAFLASICCQTINHNLVIVVSNEVIAQTISEDINAIFNQDITTLFKSREIIYQNIETYSKDYEHQRLSTAYKLLNFENICTSSKILIVPIDALHQIIMSPDDFKNLTFELKIGQIIKITDLSKKLVQLGFVKGHQVDGVGQFSVRGEIVDIFPPHLNNPIRIDFWDDEIDNIFFFDTKTQRKIDEKINNIFIPPSREVLVNNTNDIVNKIKNLKNNITNKQFSETINKDIDMINNNIFLDNIDKYIPLILNDRCNIIDYIDDPIVFFADYDNIIKSSKSVWWHYHQDIENLLENNFLTKILGNHILSWNEIDFKLKKYKVIYTNTFDNLNNSKNSEVYDHIINCYQKTISAWNGNIKLLENDIKYYQSKQFTIVILAGSEKFTESLSKDLREKNFNISNNCKNITYKTILISNIHLSCGAEYLIDKLAIITINRDVNRKKLLKKHQNKSTSISINSLEDISIGDYVVHADHGIGIFDGINKLELQGNIQDYIKIKYSGSDTLYVPVIQLDLVSKYIGNKDDGIIKLNNLNNSEWQKKRHQVKTNLKYIAKDLIKLQSQRLNSKGFAFSNDTDWQYQFEDQFEYQETDAQLRCIREIKEDMEKPYPMDRLLCGDVGVGKTEVALRAAFKAVMDNKQVVILTPTTILSWQHYNNMISRLNNFPIKIDILSRLKSKNEQKNIINQLKSGEIEIIIGTHRLLQKDVEFKDLGLIIIDEEQRFGVADKEKLKNLKCNVDVLTLSATPIPRTLNMAVSGIRDMSIIDETPQNRLPIQTYVLEYDENIIATAIIKEKRRNGIVFYLHNKVETIYQTADKISKLVPNIKVCVAHGKMSQNQLTITWEKLLNHEADVLVCTTIIETGIDIPFCNTLIVEDSDKMGLAQLHQLRGRIGRSDKRAFAYMTFKPGKVLSEISMKRLSAIKEFTKFGSGFKIALRDLEIRGSGNILGAQQHGHIDSVGYDMYLKLLSEAVAEEQGKSPDFLVSEQCTIDIKITAYLPESYIENLSHRIDIYKKIALIKTKEDYNILIDELIDRFGEPPNEVISLLDISLLRNLAIRNNIKEISENNNYINIYQEPINIESSNQILTKFQDKIKINTTDQPSIKVKIDKNENSLLIITDILSTMIKK